MSRIDRLAPGGAQAGQDARSASGGAFAARIAAVLLLFLPGVATAQSVRVGENVRVSRAHPERAHYELRVAAHPTDPEVLLGAGMAWSDSAAEYDVIAYRSSDGGESWTPKLEVDREEAVMDPDVAFGPDGWAYLTEFGGGEQLLHRSPDGGKRWVEPTEINVGDRPFLSVSGAGTDHEGRVYVHGSDRSEPLDDGRGMKAVGVVRADEQGSDLLPGEKLHVEGDRYVLGNGPSVVLSDGTLVMVYPERRDGSEIGTYEAQTAPDPRLERRPNARLRAVVSPDGGEHFSAARTVSDWYHRFGRGRSATMPALAADTSAGPFRDRLYAAWTDFRSGEGRILLSHSEDRGRSWSDPIVVNRGGGPAFRPTLAVNGDGVLGVAWYDRRDSPSGLGWSVRFAASTDGGETVGPSVRVSEEGFRYAWDRGLVTRGMGGSGEDVKADVSLHSFNEIGGHTAGMAADASGAFHPFWVGNRTGVPQIWTAAVEVDGTAVPHGDTALSELADLRGRVALRVTRTGYEGSPGVVTMEARLRNTSEDTIRGPILLRVTDAWSEFGDVTVLGGRSGETGPGAVLPVASAGPEGALPPGAATEPVEVRARVDAERELGPKRPPPPGRRTGAGYGLLNLDLVPLGRVPSVGESGRGREVTDGG